MSFTTFTPRAANTVQAQTIAAITHKSATDPVQCYKLADGTFIPIDSARVTPVGYQPVAGDYMVVTNAADGGNAGLCVWKAAMFTKHYS